MPEPWPERHPNTVTPPPKRPGSSRKQVLKPPTGRRQTGQVRIIGGQWRGRKLNVADVAGLRPTGDRVRETIFNWLQADIAGRHCLDLFAGSGALGFEALSRMAASCTFVEPDPAAFSVLCESATQLGLADAHPARFLQVTAEQFLQHDKQRFELVFIDPPFHAASQWEHVALLDRQHLAEHALVYVESPVSQSAPDLLPHNVHVCREKKFGDVCARLLRCSAL